MLRRVIVSIILASIFIGGAAAVAWYLVEHKAEPQRGAPTASAPLVETVLLTPENLREMLYGFGTARSDRQATLAAEVSAAVVERVDELREGTPVRARQVLIRLDDRQYQQELSEADALVQSARAELTQLTVERGNFANLLEIATSDLTLNREELDRVQGLFEQGHAPKTEYDNARLAYQNSLRAKQQLDNQLALIEPRRLRLQAQLGAARARSERAKLNIERCRIAAPFDGVVRELMVELGDRVRIGSPILTLVNLDRIEVPLALPVSDRLRTRVGARAVLTIESMPDSSWEGVVSRIAPVADVRSRTFAVYVEVDNGVQHQPLMPGVFVKAEIDGPVIAQALVVPRSAVIADAVYVANDQHAHKRAVHVRRYVGDRAVLAGDVRPGDAVIVTNLDLLFDGAAIRTAGWRTTAGAMASSNGESVVAAPDVAIDNAKSDDARAGNAENAS